MKLNSSAPLTPLAPSALSDSSESSASPVAARSARVVSSASSELSGHPIFKVLMRAALGWAGVSVAVCLAHGSAQVVSETLWTLGIWALCSLGLVALGKLIAAVFYLTTEPREKWQNHLVQAFYWVTVKLACFLFLNGILLKSAFVPHLAILLGLGTLGVVPLVGSLYWSWMERAEERAKEMRHA